MAATWTHLAARVVVRPLVGTPVKPNHLTTLRLLAGLSAAAAVALGTRSGELWGGALWLLSTFLDRADGELARLADLCSPEGHMYDYVADVSVNAIFFLAIGIGQRHSWLGPWSILLGTVACASMTAASFIAEEFRKVSPGGVKPIASRWGFDPDDALYLFAPICWVGSILLTPCVLLAAIGTTVFMFAFLARLLSVVRRRPIGV
jgi:archaetidylinositol phosphate synthase